MKDIALITATAILALDSARAGVYDIVSNQNRLDQQAQMAGLRDIAIVVIVIGIVVFCIWKITKRKK
jgi:hypothetical protein